MLMICLPIMVLFSLVIYDDNFKFKYFQFMSIKIK